MANYTAVYIGNNMSKLNAVLQTLVNNGIVGAVDYDDSGNFAVFTFYADAEKTTEVFKITQLQGRGTLHRKYTFRATASDGTTLQSTAGVAERSGNIDGYIIQYGYACKNGVLLSVIAMSDSNLSVTYPSFWVMITKNQDGSPVFIWGNESSTAFANHIETNMNSEYIVSSSDVAPLTTVTRTSPCVRNQTVLSPFFSCSAAGETSCTPNAGRILAGNLGILIQSTTAKELTLDGKNYLTNGYWAIEDDGEDAS